MTAPSVISYPDPIGKPMDDGFGAFIAFDLDDTISFWIRSVKPPPLDGGAPIEQSTNSNNVYETMAPQALIKVGDVTMKGTYGMGAYQQFKAMINIPQNMTLHCPDAPVSTCSFYGFVQKFEPDEFKKGTAPEASITIVVTNVDPVSGDEEGPVFGGAPGT